MWNKYIFDSKIATTRSLRPVRELALQFGDPYAIALVSHSLPLKESHFVTFQLLDRYFEVDVYSAIAAAPVNLTTIRVPKKLASYEWTSGLKG